MALSDGFRAFFTMASASAARGMGVDPRSSTPSISSA
jgi:hypothetical protein